MKLVFLMTERPINANKVCCTPYVYLRCEARLHKHPLFCKYFTRVFGASLATLTYSVGWANVARGCP